jgi:hypothetical protein
VLHPNQFHLDEAWILFKLNATPISTGADGDFNVCALMDAASCFIVSSVLVPVSSAQPSETDSRHLLEEGRAHHQRLPAALFISDGVPAKLLAAEAAREGITVTFVPDAQLQQFIGEAREGFRERFGGGSVQ